MKKLTHEEFIQRASEIHKGKYLYDKSLYVNSRTCLTIICKEHGEFKQTPKSHLKGKGCKKCGNAESANIRRSPKQKFIDDAVASHGDKYDYSKVEYKNAKTKVEIICREHGSFLMLPNSHTKQKQGCKICGYKHLSKQMTYDTSKFLMLCDGVHGDKYDYSNVDYVDSKYKVHTTCKKHGSFYKSPADHINQKQGCPKCAGVGPSKGELEIGQFIKSLGVTTTTSDRNLIYPKELDIVVPDKKLAIEFNGLLYHSEKYKSDYRTHILNKTKACEKIGYRLIHIFEDDWNHKKDIIKKFIKHLLGVAEERMFARKLKIKVLRHSMTKQFFETNHIQGASKGGISYCLVDDNNTIYAAMQFSQSRNIRGNTDKLLYELVRYATSCTVIGGASKLFKAFLNDNQHIDKIVSYSDNSLFTGDLYKILGFKIQHVTPPDYKLFTGRKRVHKSNFKKSLIKKNYPHVYDENLTEHEMCLKLKIYRIYNCGLTKWVFKR